MSEGIPTKERHRGCLFCHELAPQHEADQAYKTIQNAVIRHFGEDCFGLNGTQQILLADPSELETLAKACLCPYHQPRIVEATEYFEVIKKAAECTIMAQKGPLTDKASQEIESLFQRDAPKITVKLAPALPLPQNASIFCMHRQKRAHPSADYCSICLSDFNNCGQAWSKDSVGPKLIWCKDGCGHNFHTSCWLKYKGEVFTEEYFAAAAQAEKEGLDVCRQLLCPRCENDIFWLNWQLCGCEGDKAWYREGVMAISGIVAKGVLKEAYALGQSLMKHIFGPPPAKHE